MNDVEYMGGQIAPTASSTLQEPQARGNDPNIVHFDGCTDSEDPLNWSATYKWSVVILISVMSLVVNLAILMCAPATPQIEAEFASESQLASTVLVSIWELGEVMGPLAIGPLSEVFGRLPVYHVANILFIIFSVIAAESQSMGMLIAFRFLLGFTVASTVLNPSIVGDLFAQEKRGRALAVMGMVPFIAPILGPALGGAVSAAKGWRWTFWLTTILVASFELVFLVTYRESYKVKILERKARRLQKQTGNVALRTQYVERVAVKELAARSVLRPFKLLFTSSVLLLLSFCGAIAFGYTYIVITTNTSVFEAEYSFPEATVGLSFLGLGVGMISAALLCGFYLDRHLIQKSLRASPKPEHRLPPLLFGTVLLPCSLLIYGWKTEFHIAWIIPILGTVLVGFAFVTVSLASSSYNLDAFGIYAASAMAANTVVRNVAAAAIPLAGPPLWRRLGMGVGSTVLASASLVLIPISVALMKLGERMRKSV